MILAKDSFHLVMAEDYSGTTGEENINIYINIALTNAAVSMIILFSLFIIKNKLVKNPISDDRFLKILHTETFKLLFLTS